MPSRLQARTSSRPAAVRPGPGVGRRREPNGTPSREGVRTRPDEPDRAEAALVPPLEIREIRRERVGALEVDDRRRRGRPEVVDRRRARRPAARRARRTAPRRSGPPPRYGIGSASGSAYGIAVGSGDARRRDVEREEAAGEARAPRGVEIEVVRRLAAPDGAGRGRCARR